MAKRPSKPKQKVKSAVKKKTPLRTKRKAAAVPKRKAIKKASVRKSPTQRRPVVAQTPRPPPPPADAFDDPTEEVSEQDIVAVIERR